MSTRALAKCPVCAPVGIVEVLVRLKCSVYATVAIKKGRQPEGVPTDKAGSGT